MIFSSEISIISVSDGKRIKAQDIEGSSPKLTGGDDFASLLFHLQQHGATPIKIEADKKKCGVLIFHAFFKRFNTSLDPNVEFATGCTIILVPTMGEIRKVNILPVIEHVQELSIIPGEKITLETGPSRNKSLFRLEIFFGNPGGIQEDKIIPPAYFA